jgi:2-aminoethylphosphonate transport system substrate-binding protein
MKRFALIAALAAGVLAGPALADEVVTVYSADGLHDGTPSWYGNVFEAFTKATGVKVQYIEDGSGVVVQRVAKEATNPQCDVLVTLPPFIQKAAADGLLQAYKPAGADQVPSEQRDPQDRYLTLVNNYQDFIYNASVLKEPPKTFEELLDPKFKSKIQYSTPGQAGDGTAVMIQVFHAFGGKDAGFDYLGKLQANNVGPSKSTGKLTALVNKGELYVANGDLQMNVDQMKSNPNIRIFWPTGKDGKRTAFALPYYVGLVKGAPHADAGRKLIDFMLSRESQATVTSVAQGLPVRRDVVPTDAAYQNLKSLMQGVEIWSPDWNKVLEDLQADVERWHKVTGS